MTFLAAKRIVNLTVHVHCTCIVMPDVHHASQNLGIAQEGDSGLAWHRATHTQD